MHVCTCFKNAVLSGLGVESCYQTPLLSHSSRPVCCIHFCSKLLTVTVQDHHIRLHVEAVHSLAAVVEVVAVALFFGTPTHMVATGSGQVGGYSTDESETACKYSSEELFQRRKTKSSSAHSYFHVSTLLCKLFIRYTHKYWYACLC